MLKVYRILIFIVFLASPLILFFRVLKGKEDPKRFKEKLGFFSKKKLQGKLIWFHGSSVGEIMSVIPLLEKLEKKREIRQILVTSNTFSSSKVLKKFRLKKTIHQFFPIDKKNIIVNFLDYWKPNAVFFIESEIWPNTIFEIKKKQIPLILLNARITKKTYYKWKTFLRLSEKIFCKFDECLIQNEETGKYLKSLGSKNISKPGNLKFSNFDIGKINNLNYKTRKFINSKVVIFGGISTHEGEEEFCAKLYLSLGKSISNSLIILIPRHVNRANDIVDIMKNYNLKVHKHSSKKSIKKDTKIYLVDTFGEVRSFMKYFKVAILGGSIIPHGGQNPLEAARAGCKVLHGPNISNFREVYSILNKYKITEEIYGVEKTVLKIKKILKKKKTNYYYSKLNSIGETVLYRNLLKIDKYV